MNTGRTRQKLAAARQKLNTMVSQTFAPFRRADVSIFHRSAPPPGGGGHQFMRALSGEFSRRGLRVENNTISRTTRACLFNSFNFDFDRLRRKRRTGCRMVHRVDGPVTVYRGHDDGTDRRICQLNQELAEATIFQSYYSLEKHQELGLTFKDPTVIMNTPDPQIFHAQGRLSFDPARKIRLISTSWSDNPNKGAAVYQWLEQHLDWSRFDYTFVGRSPVAFEHIHMIGPLPSVQLANLFRQHDIFITASRNDPCSNALLEALACGLPAIYLVSGGHPEIVKEAGFGFQDQTEAPEYLDRLVAEYESRQAQIDLPPLAQVADQYLAVMKV